MKFFLVAFVESASKSAVMATAAFVAVEVVVSFVARIEFDRSWINECLASIVGGTATSLISFILAVAMCAMRSFVEEKAVAGGVTLVGIMPDGVSDLVLNKPVSGLMI